MIASDFPPPSLEIERRARELCIADGKAPDEVIVLRRPRRREDGLIVLRDNAPRWTEYEATARAELAGKDGAA